MVLQAERPLKFWGKATAGETVTVSLIGDDGKTLAEESTEADSDRLWQIVLPAVPTGRLITVLINGSQSGEREFSDVLTGEVWLLSGQSNMRWTVAKSQNASEEIAAADHPELRLFVTGQNPVSVSVDNLKGDWQVCTPETVGDFSGAGYFFGRDLQAALDRPVGLILSAVGGTPIEAWVPLDAIEADPATRPLQTEFVDYFKQPPSHRKKARGTWVYGAKSEKGPAFLYNGMVAALLPYTMRGIAWCQGEANDRDKGWGSGPDLYSTLFPMLITSWRERANQGELPFIYVELANYMDSPTDPVDSQAEINWANIREAQSSGLELPAVYAVSTIDIGTGDNIHYPNKQTVGKRLTQAALGQVYDHGETPSLSPRYLSHVTEGDRIRLSFSNAEGGLRTNDDATSRAFAIRGADGDWRWASTEIDGDEILVWNSEISNPTAVRHAWASNPDVNTFNRSGLPVMPFRTDRAE